MFLLIKSHFKNSRYYKNYGNIDHVILKFQNMKKNRLKIRHKNNSDIESIDIINSSRIILNKMILCSKNAKKYIKFSENINNDLLRSIDSQYIKNIKNFIKNGADVNMNSNYPIVYAIKNQNYEIVKFLYNKSNIQTVNDDLLIVSAYYNNLKIVKFFIKKGCSIKNHDDFNIPDIFLRGSFEIIKFLTEKYPDLKKNKNIIKITCYRKDIEIIKFLIDNRFCIDSDDNPIIDCSICGFYEGVLYFFELGYNISAKNDTALVNASKYGYYKIVKFLIKNGADVHTQDESPLISCCRISKIDIFKFLVKNGANIHARNDEVFKETCKWNGDKEILRYILNLDIDYFISRYDCIKNIVIQLKFTEFYKKFNINFIN